MVRAGWLTVVSVEQSGSSDCAGQLLPGPTTTTVLERCVCAPGNGLSGVAGEWRPWGGAPAARSNAGQVMTLPFRVPPLSAELNVAWARIALMSSLTSTPRAAA